MFSVARYGLGGAHAQIGHAGQGAAIGHETEDLHHKNAAGRGFPMRKAQVQGAKAVGRTGRALGELTPELAPAHHVAADAVGPTDQGCGLVHAACGQGLAHGRAGDAGVVHLVALHARHVKAQLGTGRIQERVVAGAARTKTEVVAHQHIPNP
jgi:hypothetical protein